jgi:hypothetical protein
MSTTSQTATTEYSITTIVTSDGVTLYGGNANPRAITRLRNSPNTPKSRRTGWYSSLYALCQAHPEFNDAETKDNAVSVEWEWNREQ